MKLTYFDINKTSHLVEEFYHIRYPKEIIPFNTLMIPYGVTGLTYVYTKGQKTSLNTDEIELKNLILNGQFSKPYNFKVNLPGFSCGINFKPTALHKLTGLDISQFTNKHLNFELMKGDFSKKIKNLFEKHNNDFKTLFINIENLLLEQPLLHNKNTIAIDNTINYIKKKEGLLSVTDILEIVPFSQKTLESQFKKMVGLTPSKYIRILRFLNLMKQYENSTIDLKDLIYMYNYYDESHFIKDFKLFTSKSPSVFFKEDFSIIKEALKDK